MIGWHPKKKVTLIQIAHWLPVLIEEFLFPRFYSFTLHSTLNARWANFYLQLLLRLCLLFSFWCSFGPFISFYFRLFVSFLYTQNAWHCSANKIVHGRFHENQNENMKSINQSILMRYGCKYLQTFYVRPVFVVLGGKRKEHDETFDQHKILEFAAPNMMEWKSAVAGGLVLFIAVRFFHLSLSLSISLHSTLG